MSTSAKEPRFRPYRAAAYGLYILVVSSFCLVVIASVSRSVAAMTPTHKPASTDVLSVRECLDAAQTLWQELELEREKLVRTTPARRVAEEWVQFRTGWLENLRVRQSQCALKSRERLALRRVYERLERVLDLYTIHAVQYAEEVGGAVDTLQESFAEARQHPAAGRLP